MALLRFPISNYDFGLADLRTDFRAPRGTKFKGFALDHIIFRCSDIEWILRKQMVRVKVPPAIRTAAQGTHSIPFPKTKREFNGHAFLEIKSTALPRAEAIHDAEDICWLLQIARGARVRMGRVTTSTSRATRGNISRHDGFSPIKNQGDGELKRFMESAWPIFREDPRWWKVTADWYAWACCASTIEVSGLIFSMLLDRITGHILKREKYPRQIDPALDGHLKQNSDDRAQLESEITAVFQGRTNFWDPGRSTALLDIVGQWNREPSYVKKIALAFEKEGLEQPTKKLLKNRHSLAHIGELPSNAGPPGDYFSDIMDVVTRLLLRTLSYTGPYFVTGKGMQILPPKTISKPLPIAKEA